MGLSGADLDPPLDDIAYLSRSNNRVAVLRELADAPRTRQDIREVTGVSRATLGRVLDGLEDRGWARSDGLGNGGKCALTHLGRAVLASFDDLMATVETTQRLRGLGARIPFDELGLDPRALVDAEVTRPSPTDATAHARRERELLERATHLTFLCNQAQPETVERYRDWAMEPDNEFEAIIAGDAIDAAMADDEMTAHLRDLIDGDGVTIHRYEGPISAMLGIIGDVASIVPLDDAGVPCAFIESTDDGVRTAVAETLATYRDDAVSVGIEPETA